MQWKIIRTMTPAEEAEEQRAETFNIGRRTLCTGLDSETTAAVNEYIEQTGDMFAKILTVNRTPLCPPSDRVTHYSRLRSLPRWCEARRDMPDEARILLVIGPDYTRSLHRYENFGNADEYAILGRMQNITTIFLSRTRPPVLVQNMAHNTVNSPLS